MAMDVNVIPDDMWIHFCPVQHGLLMVGNGEACNWCDTPRLECEAVEPLDPVPAPMINS